MATKDYLHPRWQEKRLRIMERDGFTCMCCSDTGSALHVHHRVYKKGGRIWDTDDNDLVTLCERCHENVEGMVRQIRNIGDSIAFLEEIGVAPSPVIQRIHDLIEASCKNLKWGDMAFRTLDASLASLLQSSGERAV